MNWKLCITDPQKNALTHCRGSMDEGGGWGYGYGWGDADGYGYSDGYGDGYGWGCGDGAIKKREGTRSGRSPAVWK